MPYIDGAAYDHLRQRQGRGLAIMLEHPHDVQALNNLPAWAEAFGHFVEALAGIIGLFHQLQQEILDALAAVSAEADSKTDNRSEHVTRLPENPDVAELARRLGLPSNQGRTKGSGD